MRVKIRNVEPVLPSFGESGFFHLCVCFERMEKNNVLGEIILLSIFLPKQTNSVSDVFVVVKN